MYMRARMSTGIDLGMPMYVRMPGRVHVMHAPTQTQNAR